MPMNVDFDSRLELLHHCHYKQCVRKTRQLKRLQKKIKRTVGTEREKLETKINDIKNWIKDVYEKRRGKK